MSTTTAPRSARELHITSLDGLRGVSALLVLFHHICLTQPAFANYEWHTDTARPHGVFEWLMFETPLRLVWAGQDRAILFFVLSGFVLALPWLRGRPPRYKSFILSRFWRLYPPYLVVMGFAAAGAVLLGGKQIPAAGLWFNQLGWSSALSWGAIPSILCLWNGPTSNWVDESVWSLVWEARVVLIFPLLIWPIVRWGNAGLIAVLAGLLVLSPIIKLIVPQHFANSLGNLHTALLYPGFFILGVAVARNQIAIRRWLSRGRGGVGFAVFILGLAIFWVHWPVQNSHADGVAAALILASAIGCPTLAHWLEAKFLLWLGRLSYSLYLTHVPFILALIIICHGLVPVWACALTVPFCIVAAEVFRRHVESPSVKLSHALFKQKPAGPITVSGPGRDAAAVSPLP